MLNISYPYLDLQSPVLQVVPHNVVQENSTVILTCNTESNLIVNYTLYKNNVPFANKKEHVIPHIRREQAGDYACTAYNGIYQKTTKTWRIKVKCESVTRFSETSSQGIVECYRLEIIFLSIVFGVCLTYPDKSVNSNFPVLFILDHDVPLIETLQSSQKHLKEGDMITLACKPFAFPSPKFSWFKNGTLLSKSITITLTNLTRDDAGEYTCKTYNEDSEMTTTKYLLVQCTVCFLSQLQSKQ